MLSDTIPDLTTSLLITLFGMGLVFGTIVIFWLTTKLLMRFTSEKAGSEPLEVESDSLAAERDVKLRVALVAVTVALACELDERQGPQPFPLPPTALVSTWQAVRRANQLGQRGAVR